MKRQKTKKINYLIKHISQGTVLTSVWLRKQGVDHKLAWWYVHSGWLERLAARAYKKAGDHITWMGAVAAIQQQLKLPVYVGGKTALQLLGRAHFVPLPGISRIDLFTLPTVIIPRWLKQSALWETEFLIYKTALFKPKVHEFSGLTTQEINGIELKISGPERAILEVFYEVPKKISYEESMLLMENLTQLRDRVVQELLLGCQSIKVKRLFLYAAEKFHHEWFKDLDLKSVDLGKGKRKIGEGGEYDAKYQLSVPRVRENL